MCVSKMLLVTLLALAAGSPLLAQERATYQVVVNRSNPASSLTKEQVSRFFLKSVRTWDNGQAVSPIDLPETSQLRQSFSRDILSRSTAAVVSYWQQLIYSGRDEAPPSVATDRDVLAYVRLKPGAIGYVSSTANLDGVKVISVTY